MSDLETLVAKAITLSKRLSVVSQRTQGAEFQALVVDLGLMLDELRSKLSLLQNQHPSQGIDSKSCPRCERPGRQLVSSKPDAIFGDLGSVRRTYTCSLCGFSEEQLK